MSQSLFDANLLATALYPGLVTASHRLQEEARRREDAEQREREQFLDAARRRGLTADEAERILTTAHSDKVRAFGESPYSFAHAVLQVVTTRSA